MLDVALISTVDVPARLGRGGASTYWENLQRLVDTGDFPRDGGLPEKTWQVNGPRLSYLPVGSERTLVVFSAVSLFPAYLGFPASGYEQTPIGQSLRRDQ
jgi:hypothetical protein